MTKNQTHEWHDRTEEGGKRYMRAHWDSRRWRFQVLEQGAEGWARIEQPGAEEFLALRDVLWRKYQRKRIPFKFIERVDAVLEELGVSREDQPDSQK